MSNNTAVIRSLIIYAICLPLAVYLGYILTDPFNRSNAIMVGIVLFLMVLPLLLRFYHVWLIAVWNSALLFYFLPGQLYGWCLMSFLGFGVALGHYILNRQRGFVQAPSVAWSLIFLALVVAVTAKFRGGIGLHVLGDETIGGKRYFYIWLAILGYFAMTSEAIPPRKRNLYTILFVGAGVTLAIGDIAAMLGGPFHFIFLLFPTSGDPTLFAAQHALDTDAIVRFAGFGGAGVALALTLVARHGIDGIVDVRKLWRPILLLMAFVLVGLGGFRSMLILVGITFGLVFCFEGHLRSRLTPIAVLCVLLCGGLTLAFSDHLPFSFQRCIAFVPGVKISSAARESADVSSLWRVQIWKSLLPSIPKYLLLGKGLGIDVNDWEEYYQFGNDEVGERWAGDSQCPEIITAVR